MQRPRGRNRFGTPKVQKTILPQMEGIEAKGEDGVRETGKIKSCRALKEGHGKEYRFYSHVMEAIIGF